MRIAPPLITVVLGLISYGYAQDLPSVQRLPLVACPIDWDNESDRLVDFSQYLHAPAGHSGFIRVRNGRLVTADGARFRIWGVNITSGFGDQARFTHSASPAMVLRTQLPDAN